MGHLLGGQLGISRRTTEKNSRGLEKRPSPMGPGATSRPLLTSGGSCRGDASVPRHGLGSRLGLRKRRRLSAGAVARSVVEKTTPAAYEQNKKTYTRRRYHFVRLHHPAIPCGGRSGTQGRYETVCVIPINAITLSRWPALQHIPRRRNSFFRGFFFTICRLRAEHWRYISIF